MVRPLRAVVYDKAGRNGGVMDMHVGLTMFPTDYSIAPHELAVAAEARGYDSLWLPEHSHIPTSRKSPWPGGAELPKYYYESYDPFLSLAAAAAVTKTIKLATGIRLVVERDQIHTAKEVSTIDQLSSGRFIFGVGGSRAYDVSDGLLDSTARPCRGGGGARLRVIVVAGAQSHSHQSQIAVARRR